MAEASANKEHDICPPSDSTVRHRNSELRTSLLERAMVPYDLVRADQNSLATKDQIENMRLAKELAWHDAQVATVPMDETDQFQCGKCKAKRCIYFQKQTRCANEPMTHA